VLIVGADVLAKAIRKHRDASASLRAWTKVVKEADWESIVDVRRTYPSADGVSLRSGGVATVFNIRGNNYRLLVRISYRARVVSVVEFLTHAEYSKDSWKERL